MISLCIISRKEDESSLEDSFISVHEFVDEIVIVDTSKEGAISRGVSKFSTKVRVIPFKWTNNFAAARNFAFEQATGDVIFWIDSDDTVTHPENLPKLAKLITDGDADWIYSKYNYHRDEWGNVDAAHWKPRLFRKGSVKWEKTVHEDTVPTEGVIQVKDIETGVGTVEVEHHSDEVHHKESAERNLSILMAEYVKDGDNTDPRTLQYLGMSYQALVKHQEAITFFTKHIEKTGSQSDRFWSLHRLSASLHTLGDHRNAISVVMDCLKLYPEWKTGYFDLASIYYSLGDWAKVVDWTLVGLDKADPDILDVVDEVQLKIAPLQRLCEAYLNLNQPEFALDVAKQVLKENPNVPVSKEMFDVAVEGVELENYVRAFIRVANEFRKYDRVKTTKLFDLIPPSIDDDVRIQQLRAAYVPPKVWGEKSIVIYCGNSLEDWAYPSVFTGIGGSEEAVINVSQQLSTLGYEVIVYNRCGKLRGTYDGVEYKPYYHLNLKDQFNTFISWRNPGIFIEKFAAKKKYLWLHDILYPEMINEKIIENVDKILFLSKWHSENVLTIPKDKIFITNNGINPDDFLNLPEKRPSSLIWSSSYDRGLLPFITNILPLIKDKIPDVTLDVAYGWQNIEKEMGHIPHLKELYTELSPLLESTPGITHHGRLSHKKLADLMGSSMVYPYASEFGETNNITSQKCQAAGCYVITTSQAGGTPERVFFGKVIDGDGVYTDPKLQKQFAEAVIDYLKNKNQPKPVGTGKVFAWSTTANQWVKDLL